MGKWVKRRGRKKEMGKWVKRRGRTNLCMGEGGVGRRGKVVERGKEVGRERKLCRLRIW